MLLTFIFILSLKTVVVCNDDEVICTPAGLPELPQDATFYPHISTSFTNQALFGSYEDTRAYYVFGKPAMISFPSMFSATSKLQEINFYAPYEWIEIECGSNIEPHANESNFRKVSKMSKIKSNKDYQNSPNDSKHYYVDEENKSICTENIIVTLTYPSPYRIKLYNLTRVKLNILNYVDLSTPFNSQLNTMFFFSNGGEIIPNNQIFMKTNDYSISVHEIKPYYKLMISHSSAINIYAFADEAKEYSLVIYDGKIKFFDTEFGIQGPFVSYDGHYQCIFTKYSDYSKPILIKRGIDRSITLQSSYNFEVHYKEQAHELGIEDHTILFGVDDSFVNKELDKALTIKVYIKSPNLHVLIMPIEGVDFRYSVYSYDGTLIESVPVETSVVLYSNIDLVDKKASSLLLFHKYVDQEDLDSFFMTFGKVKTLNIYFDLPELSINFSQINMLTEMVISSNATNESVLYIVDPPKSYATYFALGGNITFLPDKVDLISRPEENGGFITNPEKINYLRIFCNLPNVETCPEVPQDKSVFFIYFMNPDLNALQTIYHFLFVNDSHLVIIGAYDIIMINYQEEGKINTKDLIFHLDVQYITSDLFSPLPPIIQFEIDPSVTSLPNITLYYQNELASHYIKFDDSFKRDIGKPFEVKAYINRNKNLHCLDPPLWVTYMAYDVDEPDNILDKSPITSENLGLCVPGTGCTGLIFPSSMDIFVYITDTTMYDFEMTQLNNRLTNSLNFSHTVYIIYASLLPGVTESYNVNVFDKAGLYKVKGTLHFVNERAIYPVSISIEQTEPNQADTWIIDNLTIMSGSNWNVRNITMVNSGKLISFGSSCKYLELDHINLGYLATMTFEEILIRLTVYTTCTIKIKKDKIIIDNYEGFIPATLKKATIVITQYTNITEISQITIDTDENDSPINISFICEHLTTNISLRFTSTFTKIANSPLYVFLSFDLFDVLINNVRNPVKLIHYDHKGKIVELFPITPNDITICYSNDTFLCREKYYEITNRKFSGLYSDNDYRRDGVNNSIGLLYNVSKFEKNTNYFFKHINTEHDLESFIESIENTIENFTILTNNNISSVDISHFKVKDDNFYLWVEGLKSSQHDLFETDSFISVSDFSREEQNSFLEDNSEINLDQLNNILLMENDVLPNKTISITFYNTSHLNFKEFAIQSCSVNIKSDDNEVFFSNKIIVNEGKLSVHNLKADVLKTPVFGYHSINGTVKNVIFNYTNVLVQSVPLISIKNYEPFMNITFSSKGIFLDTNFVSYYPFNSDNVTYELVFNKTSTLVLSISDFPSQDKNDVLSTENLEFYFRIIFYELKKGYIDSREINLKFDESWNKIQNGNYSQNMTKNIILYFSTNLNNKINYVLQEKPSFIDLNIHSVGNGINRPTPTVTMDVNIRTAPQQLFIAIISFAVIVIVIVLAGIIVVYQIKLKKSKQHYVIDE
ncbi:hypothetical protein TRFO_29721 [Tritrichomonas foetus]|uniref:Uncharacterized protein n=1 Tax=Tritrichomonas foetus TaxID=1144522 RepID=A0A1J4JZU4_9EUKA|nr:hypothetical protein TRFO_29721 [Tritrichomonas foetus]|eukprot:OHT03014.1 hypothetical protein TRFO_29721 [Tritrichomonas foetus]